MTPEPAAIAVQTRSMAALKTWHDRYTEAAIAPELPIIDAHHHMWDRPPEHYGLPELLAEFAQGHNIRASVFVECTAMFKADGPESLRPVGETGGPALAGSPYPRRWLPVSRHPPASTIR
jgi:hypothetical protein